MFLPFWRIFCTLDPMLWVRRLNSVSRLAEFWYEDDSMIEKMINTLVPFLKIIIRITELLLVN